MIQTTSTQSSSFNRLTLASKRCILYVYSTNICTEYFKHALYSPFFPLQNAICFIMLTCLVPVLFTFYIQGVLKLKKNNSGAKGLTSSCDHGVSIYSFNLYHTHQILLNSHLTHAPFLVHFGHLNAQYTHVEA